jgi:hypothetical protein
MNQAAGYKIEKEQTNHELRVIIHAICDGIETWKQAEKVHVETTYEMGHIPQTPYWIPVPRVVN